VAGADALASSTIARGCAAWPVVVEALRLPDLPALQPGPGAARAAALGFAC
jgi:hypothetical protein